MITKEQLSNFSARSKVVGPSKVYTSEQALENARGLSKTLVCISSKQKEIFFFTDDHTSGYGVLSKDWPASTTFFPLRVAEREGIENGICDTVEKYISVFQQGIVDFLNWEKGLLNHEESDESYSERMDRILETKM